jgi:hypothetical protein
MERRRLPPWCALAPPTEHRLADGLARCTFGVIPTWEQVVGMTEHVEFLQLLVQRRARRLRRPLREHEIRVESRRVNRPFTIER